MIRGIQLETRKFLDTRVRRLLAIAALCLQAAIAVGSFVADSTTTFSESIIFSVAPFYLALPILIITATCGEISGHGALFTLTANPHRWSVAGAKAGAAVILSGACAAFTWGTSLVSSLAVNGYRSVSLHDVATGLVSTFLPLAINSLVAIAVAFLIAHSVAAIVVYYLFTASVDSIAHFAGAAAPFLSFNAAVEAVAQFDTKSLGATCVSLLVWVLIPLTMGALAFSRRDLR